ncbi:MAG: uroporphyrinogen-III C-methyltransferase [Candidatus Methylomirabilales bacterium]
MTAERAGKVYLVGAGPGDPGLLTLKGRRCLEQADVVVYDALANPRLLRHTRGGAELIYAGKRGGAHALPQAEIEALLVQHARAGRMVVRLKGGDPFLFGRGGEEAEALVAAGIPFEVVPGVSAAVAVPAYAGIPLTHRELTSTVAFITGHEDPAKDESRLDWGALAKGIGTLVFFMGVSRLPEIVRGLLEHGRSPDTPAALIRWGTRAEQAVVSGRLGDLVEKGRRVSPPALIVVGDVVGLREKLAWTAAMPLFGKRVLITRTREQASALADRLEAAGAEVIEFPTIAIAPPESWAPLDRALAQLADYRCVILTSSNGVEALRQRLRAAGADARAFAGKLLVAIGPATAAALEGLGLRADLVPKEFTAEGLVEALGDRMAGARVLLVRAAEAREVVPQELASRGARVEVVPAYRTVMPDLDPEPVRAMLRDGQVHAVTFTSSSTVAHFVRMLGPEAAALLQRVAVASIGPITAETADRHGITTSIMPQRYTIPALTEAIIAHFQMSRT